MKTYDWIVVGAGLTGAALSYELAKKGFSVLLLEQHASIEGATRYSYGGIAYWAGTTELTHQLGAAGIARQRILSEELDTDTQFREIDLLLTIAANKDPEKVANNYKIYASSPRLISVSEACEMEPLLNGEAISGALTIRHANVNPQALVAGYCQAFLRHGGTIQIARVKEILRQGNRINGVVTSNQETYHAANVIVCAGGFSRALLKASGIAACIYFTHAELIETPAVDVQLKNLIVPAEMELFKLETEAAAASVNRLWDESGHEPLPAIIEAGAIQFLDGSMRIGQISRVLTDPNAKVDPVESEAKIRDRVGLLLPKLRNLPGTWHHCLVAFSSDQLPLVGAFPELEGIHIFSGFTSPFVFVPPLAQKFANYAAGDRDPIISQLSPARFSKGMREEG